MTTRARAALARAANVLLTSPRAALLVAGIYTSFGLVSVVTDRDLDDEGLLTHIFASWLRIEPLATLFLQKTKPVLAALYLVPSYGGARTTLVAHLLVGAAAIPLLAAVGRALGHRFPNVAAIVLAASPIYFVGGPAGISNVDGVAAGVLFLYLYVARDRPVWAGVVLGMVVWVRFELAILVLTFALYDLVFRRRVTLVLGVLAFPVAYAIAGAAYHADVLWWLHFPPALPGGVPGNPGWHEAANRIGSGNVVRMLCTSTPLLALAFLAPVTTKSGVERAVLAYVLANAAVLMLMPVWHLFNFAFTPRYGLQSLPFVALLIGRALESRGSRVREALLLTGALALGLAALRDTGWTDGLWASLGCALVVLAARAWTPLVASWVAVAVALAGPPLFHDATLVGRDNKAAYVTPVAAWLRAHADHRPVYTNVSVLAATLPGTDVRYIVESDQSYELLQLTNERNGQRAAILRAVHASFYGRAIWPDELTPDQVPSGALFALVPDRRLTPVMPPAVWAEHLRSVQHVGRVTISEERP